MKIDLSYSHGPLCHILCSVEQGVYAYLGGHALRYLGKAICNETLSKINPLALAVFNLLAHLSMHIIAIGLKKKGWDDSTAFYGIFLPYPVGYYLTRSYHLLTPVQAIAGCLSTQVVGIAILFGIPAIAKLFGVEIKLGCD